MQFYKLHIADITYQLAGVTIAGVIIAGVTITGVVITGFAVAGVAIVGVAFCIRCYYTGVAIASAAIEDIPTVGVDIAGVTGIATMSIILHELMGFHPRSHSDEGARPQISICCRKKGFCNKVR